MSRKIFMILIVILVAGLSLTACDRSASTSPMTTPTANGEIPFPVATQSQIMKDILAATQTAEAMNGTVTTGNLPGIVTSTPAFSYSTPTSDLTSVVSTEIPAATNTPVPATATPVPTAYPTITPGQPTQYATCPLASGNSGVPTITISAVAKNQQITIYATNFPAGQTLNVRMGSYGSEGVNGTIVTTQNSGPAGCFSATYSIPASLAGSSQIAIRLETTNGYYFGYNWFYNTSTN